MIKNENRAMELTANIHLEDGSYWADVPKLPGCFASGDNLEELFDSLHEGVRLYLDEEGSVVGRSSAQPLRVTAAVLSDAPGS